MRIKNVTAFAAAAATAAIFSSAPAYAGTQTTTFTVSADVAANCTIGATDLDFTAYNPAGGNVDAQSTVSVTCTNSSAWNIGLNEGTFTGATTATRKMTGPGTYSLSYGLFSDTNRSVNWGKVVSTDTVGGTGTGANQSKTIYGRIAGTQNVGAGHYSDTITATVTF